MSTEIKAYICDFCTRKKTKFLRKATADRHEKQCFFNPVRKACASCAHFTFEKSYYEAETGYTEPGGPFCDIDKLNTDPGEQPLRSDCEFWQGKP